MPTRGLRFEDSQNTIGLSIGGPTQDNPKIIMIFVRIHGVLGSIGMVEY